MFSLRGRWVEYSEETEHKIQYPELNHVPDFILEHSFIDRGMLDELRIIVDQIRELKQNDCHTDEIKVLNKKYNTEIDWYFLNLATTDPRDNLDLFLSSELKMIIRNVNKDLDKGGRLRLGGKKDDLLERLRTYYTL